MLQERKGSTVLVRMVLGALMALFITACTSAPPPDQKPPDQKPVDQTPAGFYPADTRTGKAEVDQVIAAVTGPDNKALQALVKLSAIACTDPGKVSVGDLPCPAGTPAGTIVEAFPYSACQPNFIVGRDLVNEAVRNRFANRNYVYAAYQTPAGYDLIVGSGTAGDGSKLELDQTGAVVGVVNCAGPANMVPGPGHEATPLLPPKNG